MNKNKKYRSKAFTLVEVLICVGIIGIIAAITIPALLSSTSEKALEAQRKALYSRMAQAFAQINNLRAYKLDTELSAMALVTNGLSNVYKISKICEAGKFYDCGVPDSVIDYYNEVNSDSYTISSQTTLSAYNDSITEANLGNFAATSVAFKTVNGESILLWYNPNCAAKTDSEGSIINSACANMIYDVNGRSQKPNQYGEDIGFITVFYPSDPVVVAPILYNKELFNGTYKEMLAKATELDLVPPTIEELTAILINKNLTHITKTGTSAGDLYWSATYVSSNGSETELWTAGLDLGIKKEKVATTTGGATTETAHPYFLIRK